MDCLFFQLVLTFCKYKAFHMNVGNNLIFYMFTSEALVMILKILIFKKFSQTLVKDNFNLVNQCINYFLQSKESEAILVKRLGAIVMARRNARQKIFLQA